MYLKPDSDLAAIHATLTTSDNDIEARQAAKSLLDLIDESPGYRDYMTALHFFCELLSRPYLFPGRGVADVLEAAEKTWHPFTPSGSIDHHEGLMLAGAQLAGNAIDFTAAALQHANLTDAHLYGKTFQGADLTGADLHGALCARTAFVNCRLTAITLVEAECRGFTITNGDGRPFNQIPAFRADLTRALLDECVLQSVNLQGASLVYTSLQSGTLRDVDLRGANLTRADLTGATLAEVDLRGANLTGAYLTDATLTEVDLRGANLTGIAWNRSSEWTKVQTDDAITGGAELPNQEDD